MDVILCTTTQRLKQACRWDSPQLTEHVGGVLVQAPVKPKSPVGEMLAYYFKAQPHLFKDAIKQQLVRLRDERDERETQQAAADAEKQDSAAPTSSMDITLYRCAMARERGCPVISVCRTARSKLDPGMRCGDESPW